MEGEPGNLESILRDGGTDAAIREGREEFALIHPEPLHRTACLDEYAG